MSLTQLRRRVERSYVPLVCACARHRGRLVTLRPENPPTRFDEEIPHARVAGLGDAPNPAFLARAPLAWHQPEKRLELMRRDKSPHVIDGRDNRARRNRAD